MIANRIRQARLAAGLTLSALGEQVGITHTAIQKYEKGSVTPSSAQLLKLACVCGVRTDIFVPITSNCNSPDSAKRRRSARPRKKH